MFPYCKLKEDEVRKYLHDVTPKMVEQSLRKIELKFSDFLNFISPCAQKYIKRLHEKASRIKKQHFGKTIRLYSPLYLSNYCINQCEYCGFRASNRCSRKRLSIEESVCEAEVIKNFGINSLLLVSGEDPKHISVEYLEKLTEKLKKMFSYISIEIYPLSRPGYQRLFNAGVHGLTLYQETYDEPTYYQLHKKGPKRDYNARLQSVIYGGEAGFYNIGLGVLLGLYDWKIESVSLASHALWLRKHFWKTRIQFSFPRITPITGGFVPPNEVSERELEQMILAFRIFFPEADIYLSTRESASFRDKMAISAVTHISAASRVVPGGYSQNNILTCELGQFSLHDNRSVEEISEALKDLELEPVFKDWDEMFGYKLSA